MSKELEKTQPAGALATVDDLKAHAGQGTEGIGASDVRPPKVVLAQSGHPQTKKNNEAYIQGLAEGDLFNDLTNAIYKTPLAFVVIKFLGRRAVEFWPEEEKAKHDSPVKDFNVPLDDPRCQPTIGPDNSWTPPIADVYADYLVFLPDSGEVVTVTFKNADLGRKGAGTMLNSLMKYPLNLDGTFVLNPPAWARTFELSSAGKSDGAYNWSVYTLKPRAGVTAADIRAVAASLYEQFSKQNVVVGEDVPAEPVADTDVPF